MLPVPQTRSIPAQHHRARDSMTEPGQEIVRHRARNSRGTLEPWQKLSLCRELALSEASQRELGVKYGMTQQGISDFAKRNVEQITEIREHMADQFAGLPLVRKENRLAAYEQALADLKMHPNNNHHEWIKAQFIGLRNIAEELGDLPPRSTVTINPVIHMVQGVDTDEL